MKSTSLIKLLVNITEIVQNNLDIFGEAVESSPRTHLDKSCLKLQEL